MSNKKPSVHHPDVLGILGYIHFRMIRSIPAMLFIPVAISLPSIRYRKVIM
jgi:hypothetical protein